MKKIIFFLVISLFCLPPLSNFAQTKSVKQQASQTVSEFYKFHRQSSGLFNRREIETRKKWFSPRLYQLFLYELKREKEFLKANPTDKPTFGEGLKFEPWEECVSEGKSYSNWYKVGKSTINKNKAIVEVAFYNPQKCENGKLISTHSVELIKLNNKWLINDFVFPSRGAGRFDAYPLTGRLSAILKRKEY